MVNAKTIVHRLSRDSTIDFPFHQAQHTAATTLIPIATLILDPHSTCLAATLDPGFFFVWLRNSKLRQISCHGTTS